MEGAQLAATDPTTTRFEATVTDVDGQAVRLSETYFYAESGGQPADRGTVGASSVADVQVVDGEVVHYLDDDPDFEAGQRVACAIDEAYRTYCMRAHTASHVLYGAGRRLLDDLGYGGFGITDEKVRVDFVTTTDVDDEVLVELERLANRAVWESRPVSWEQIPTSEARSRDDVAFNTKTEEGVFGESASVRIVTVGGEDGNWDVAACGGTHVSNTREIGPVTVLERSNPGEGMTRVEFAVGPSAIRRRADEKRALLSASGTAGTGYGELPGEVDRLQDEVASLEAELDDLRGDVVGARIAELADETVERDGATWLAGSVEGVGPNEVEDHVRGAAGDAADVVVLVGRDGSTFVAAGASGDADAGDVVGEITDEFGGGGGGSPSFAQGGGIQADPDEVVAFLRGGE